MNKVLLCILDTETTGLPTKNDFSKINMIELAYIIVDLELNVVKEKNFLIKGDYNIPEFITSLTGITKEITNEKGIELSKVSDEFYNDIKQCEFIMAHNLRFDYGMLKKELGDKHKKELMGKIQFCSINIFKNEIEKGKMINYKLETIYNHLHPEPYNQTHRALDDCHMILSSMKRIENINLWNYYWNKQLNIGKHKHRKWSYYQLYKNDINYYNFIVRKVHRILPYKIKHFYR
jgi:DNA polymerase III alpha subunit (gram-positive type)